MDDTLSRLLEAERHAEALVETAAAEKAAATRDALEKARKAEEAFFARRTPIRDEAIGKARERAEQTIGELRRRHDEQAHRLREKAVEREAEAVAVALAYVIEPRSS